MDPKQVAKQMIDFSKTAFDNSFEAMAVVQDNTEKIVNNFIEQNTMMPDDAKKAFADWIKAYKKGRNDFKATADENFKKVEALFAGK